MDGSAEQGAVDGPSAVGRERAAAASHAVCRAGFVRLSYKSVNLTAEPHPGRSRIFVFGFLKLVTSVQAPRLTTASSGIAS